MVEAMFEWMFAITFHLSLVSGLKLLNQPTDVRLKVSRMISYADSGMSMNLVPIGFKVAGEWINDAVI